MTPRLIAVLDVGKTNAKLSLLDVESGEAHWTTRRPSTTGDAPGVRELDVAGIEHWLLRSLAEAPDRDRISHIVPVAHGATVALLDAAGETLCAPDYEDPSFEEVAAEYARERDPFGCTLSPDLALGLNVGRQLFYLETRQPELFGRARWILLHPQYWAWRLARVMASEITSLGCHTDLWRPIQGSYSALTQRRGWTERFPPLRPAGAVLGHIAPTVCEATGLNPTCAVLCGIHDSNASYLRHLLSHPNGEQFAVISSGTWCVVMTRDADLAKLRESRGMLANVNAFGQPVATARFMGGREFVAIAGAGEAVASLLDLEQVLEAGSLAVPSFAPGGLFGDRAGQLIAADGLDTGGRAALATLYLALMTDAVLDTLESSGTIIVDGPLATNALYGEILQSLRPDDTIRLSLDQSGAGFAACYLVGGGKAMSSLQSVYPILGSERLRQMRQVWREAIDKATGRDVKTRRRGEYSC